jgi:predicted CopG family antitoxin
MPPRGWATVSVREDVRRALEEIASQKGFSSLNDVIAFLLDKYREFTDVSVKLTDMSVRCDKLLTDISVKLDKLLQAGTPLPQTETITASPPAQTVAQSKAGPRERKRVIVFTLEWAQQKGINVEEYMTKREKEGYICNETGREIVCIWREDLEQLVIELNSAGVKMGELDKALSGEKLNTARIAERAGLLWYDNKEKRWRAPL